MSELDPEDDTQDCFVVQHFRFDPQRSERRLQVVSAFTTKREALRDLRRRQRELAKLQESGIAEQREYLCSGPRRAGQKVRAAQTRIELRKMRSGWVTAKLNEDSTNPEPSSSDSD